MAESPYQLNASSRSNVTQIVAYTGSAAGTTAGFSDKTFHIRVVSSSASHYKIGASGVAATTSDPFLPANWYEYVRVNPGEFVSFIRASTNGLVTATSGSATVTELT